MATRTGSDTEREQAAAPAAGTAQASVEPSWWSRSSVLEKVGAVALGVVAAAVVVTRVAPTAVYAALTAVGAKGLAKALRDSPPSRRPR